MQNRLNRFVQCCVLGFLCVGGVFAQTGAEPAIPLVINEVMAANVTGVTDGQGDYADWLELHNTGDETLDVGGMYLTDDLEEPTKWQIPLNDPLRTAVAPGGYVLIWMDNDLADPGLHAGFKLSADGETVALFARDGATLIDQIEFGVQRPDIAYGRFPDGTDQWRFLAFPSPGRGNTGLYLGFVGDTRFSVDRGLYDAPFALTITSDTPDAIILYTLDGSTPEVTDFSHPMGTVYDGPIRIDRTTCVRALAYLPGWMPSKVDTHTYLFPADVADQPENPPGFPSRWGSVQADYAMDPEVVKDPRYQGHLRESLLSLPSMSLVTDIDGLFGAQGIYTHSTSSGEAWERAGSVELLYPEGQEGFQLDCGIRIQGGWFRSHSGTRKHSFRLLFKTVYGRSKLRFPLFGEGAADAFDTITLRAGANDGYAWSDAKYTEQYVRDEFGRSLQRATGQVGAHGTFVHLYVNGLYWGLYNPVERPDNAFSAAYFGGEKEQWDAIHDGGAVYGSTAAWNQMLSVAQQAGRSFTAYQALQGRDPQGLPDASLPHWLDVTNYVDYLIVNLLGGNWDWPWKNWWAGRLRTDGSTGFKFYCWDYENTMGNNRGRSPLHKNALNNNFSSAGQPHAYLKGNPEYRLHFADRIHRLLFNDSVLTPDALVTRYADLAARIETAMIAESARWGDQHHHPPLTQAEWLNERDWLLNTYLPQRSDIVLAQFRQAGLYPEVEAPVFAIDGLIQYGGHVPAPATLSLHAPAGDIWFTLDGADPRVPGTGSDTVAYTTLVGQQAPKRVLVPSGPVPLQWYTDPAFDDGHWQSGTGGVGYERNNGYQGLFDIDVSHMYQGNTSCLVRIAFQAPRHAREFNVMTLNMRYDDGFVAYINGREVARAHAPQTLLWNASAPQQNSDGAAVQFEPFDISTHLDVLRPGDNVLAIHGLNERPTSSDFLISAELLVARASGDSDLGIAPDAQAYMQPIALGQTRLLRARTLLNGVWSALSEAVFSVGPVAESLRITEIMYHPTDPNTEYLELTNIGSESLHLSGVRFTRGLDFVFPDLVLQPRERLVLVQDEPAFAARYGTDVYVAGHYQGSLSNGGERIALQDAVGTVIHDFCFKDGWYEQTDGQGHSLVIVDVLADPAVWSEKEAWQPSLLLYGTPGSE